MRPSELIFTQSTLPSAEVMNLPLILILYNAFIILNEIPLSKLSFNIVYAVFVDAICIWFYTKDESEHFNMKNLC